MTGDWSAAHFESKSIPDCSQKLPNAIPKQFGRRPVVKVYFQSACGVLGEAKMARFVWAHVHNQSLPRSALTSTNLGKTVFFLFQASSLHIFGLALVARHFIFELQFAIQDVRFQSSSSVPNWDLRTTLGHHHTLINLKFSLLFMIIFVPSGASGVLLKLKCPKPKSFD